MPEIFSTLGATVLPASALEAAHGNLKQQLVYYAVIDINIEDPTSFGVANWLRELDIPVSLRVRIQRAGPSADGSPPHDGGGAEP